MIKSELLRSLSTFEIIGSALKEKNAKRYWTHVAELHRRGSRVEFEKARELTKSPAPQYREMGADILGQLGCAKQKFQKQSVRILIEMLSDSDPMVIASSAFALGHRDASEAAPFLAKLKNHRKRDVREGVVYGLLGQESQEAIETLIHLSKDRTEEVRDWATFGLGTQIDVDTPEIRSALESRLNEKNIEIRGEALVGLAKRRHPNAIKWTKRALSEKNPIVLYLEAAEILASPKLYPDLIRIKRTIKRGDNEYFISCLDKALKACKPKGGIKRGRSQQSPKLFQKL